MIRKNISPFIAIAVLALGLAACGGTNPSTAGTVNPDRLSAAYANALPVESQLVLGTLKLEGTPQAVDTATAANLLPLYLLLQQLTASGSAAPAEITAVLDQIQQTMSPAQIHAIAAMKLTQTDLTNYFGGSGQSAAGRTRTPGASARTGGNFTGGGPPDGGFAGGGGNGASQNQIATLRAERTQASGSGGTGTPAFLLNQLIALLEKRSPTSTPTP